MFKLDYTSFLFVSRVRKYRIIFLSVLIKKNRFIQISETL